MGVIVVLVSMAVLVRLLMRVMIASFVLMLCLRMVMMRRLFVSALLMKVVVRFFMRMRCFWGLARFKDSDLRAGDAAAIDSFDLQ